MCVEGLYAILVLELDEIAICLMVFRFEDRPVCHSQHIALGNANPHQIQRPHLMLRLRTVDGIEKGEYTRSFLLPFEPIEEILLRLQAQEYAAFTSGRWHLTPKGFMLSNTILVELLEAQQKSRPLAQKR